MASRRPGNSKTTGVAVVAACVVLLIIMLGLFKGRGASGTIAKSPPAAFTVFYTCDTRGHIEPCGCTSGMAGGISRRQSRRHHRRAPSVGDSGAGVHPQGLRTDGLPRRQYRTP
ncbi:MAG: hypothetical protein ACYTFQ_14075 [Planctomycetota bacterium]